MRLHYKPNNPVVTCLCGRSIATTRGKVNPHHTKVTMKASEPICKGSFMSLTELKEHKRVVVI